MHTKLQINNQSTKVFLNTIKKKTPLHLSLGALLWKEVKKFKEQLKLL